MTSISAIILGLLSGFVGWILSEFISKPIRRGLDLAAEAKAALIEFANVRSRFDAGGKSNELSPDEELRLREAEAKYRKLSAALYAFAQTDWIANAILTKVIFDPSWAATSLMGLSNNIGQYGGGRHAAIEEAKKALKIDPFKV